MAVPSHRQAFLSSSGNSKCHIRGIILNEMTCEYLIYARMENADRAERTLVSAVAESTCGPHHSGMSQASVTGQPAQRIASLRAPIKC